MPPIRFQTVSVAIHLLALTLILLVTSPSFVPATLLKTAVRSVPLVAPPPPPRVTTHPGGGSNYSATPATRGTPPPRSVRTFIPPHTRPDPALPMPVSIDFDVPVIAVADPHYGDPLAKVGPLGYGAQGGGGIGSIPGCCGIGDQPGGRGISGRIPQPMRPAEVVYRVEPEFSEEARKAKFQGMVVLSIEIGPDGRAHNLRVITPAGMGLDQKAIEAVEKWRFRPAQQAGKPVSSTARVEVFFHLL